MGAHLTIGAGNLYVGLPDEPGRLIARPVGNCPNCGGHRTVGRHPHTWQCRRCHSVWAAS